MYNKRKVLLLIFLAVSMLAIGMLYIRHRINQNQMLQEDQSTDVIVIAPTNDLQAHIASLNSRIKHLSLDNKRLSITGHKLVEQLEVGRNNMKTKLTQTKELQIDLASLDQNIIGKYENFLRQQEVFLKLHSTCGKLKGKEKEDKKCTSYIQAKTNIDELNLQIKFLKAKREVVLSQIARTYGGL